MSRSSASSTLSPSGCRRLLAAAPAVCALALPLSFAAGCVSPLTTAPPRDDVAAAEAAASPRAATTTLGSAPAAEREGPDGPRPARAEPSAATADDEGAVASARGSQGTGAEAPASPGASVEGGGRAHDPRPKNPGRYIYTGDRTSSRKPVIEIPAPLVDLPGPDPEPLKPPPPPDAQEAAAPERGEIPIIAIPADPKQRE